MLGQIIPGWWGPEVDYEDYAENCGDVAFWAREDAVRKERERIAAKYPRVKVTPAMVREAKRQRRRKVRDDKTVLLEVV